MHKMLFGVFPNIDDANSAMAELTKNGVSRDNISVIVQDSIARQRIEKNVATPGEIAVSGAAAGGATGAAIGALTGFLVGAGMVTLPVIGGMLIAGPIAAALGLTGVAATTASGAVTGAVAGGLVGALVKLGLPEERAKYYEDRIKAGNILLTVNADNEGERQYAESVFQKYNASEINYYTLA